MSILDGVEDKRNFRVPDDKSFKLCNGQVLFTLDELSEAINLIDPGTFSTHVNGDRNDFAAWVEYVFGEVELANALRQYPTPLRMMVSIEKFLRQQPVSSPASEQAPTPEQPAQPTEQPQQ
jgi:hypothetical protein